jgi:hypothetical protein
VGKGTGTRRKYLVRWSDFIKIAKAYDYEPQGLKEGEKSK